MWRLISVILLFCLFVMILLIQTAKPTDFDRLMAGEEVTLNWESGVVWDDLQNQVMPPAAELLSEFVQKFVTEPEEDEDFSELYVLFNVLLYASPEFSVGVDEPVWLGLNASTARWDDRTRTLFLQSQRYLPATRPDGQMNGVGCGLSRGDPEGPMLKTQVNKCVSSEDRRAGFEFMPTTTVYRMGVFTVQYLPPIKE